MVIGLANFDTAIDSKEVRDREMKLPVDLESRRRDRHMYIGSKTKLMAKFGTKR